MNLSHEASLHLSLRRNRNRINLNLEPLFEILMKHEISYLTNHKIVNSNKKKKLFFSLKFGVYFPISEGLATIKNVMHFMGGLS